jgi:hypothetical protein
VSVARTRRWMRCFEPVNFRSGGLGVVAMIIRCEWERMNGDAARYVIEVCVLDF